MSIKFIDDLTFDIYLKKESIYDINLNDRNDLEIYLKELFKTLRDKYNIKVEGFYNIIVYIDKYYGSIIHLEKEDIDYYDYFKNQVDMRLIIENTEFLYLVDDVPNNNKFDVIIKDNNIYLKIKEELSELEMMKLMESSKIVI